MILSLSCLLLLYLILKGKSDSLDDESSELESDSGSYGMYSFCAFYLIAEESVVGVLASIIFAPIVVEYVAGVFSYDIFAPIGVKYKGGTLLAMFWCSNC